jgi:hypothetical protein
LVNNKLFWLKYHFCVEHSSEFDFFIFHKCCIFKFGFFSFIWIPLFISNCLFCTAITFWVSSRIALIPRFYLNSTIKVCNIIYCVNPVWLISWIPDIFLSWCSGLIISVFRLLRYFLF